MSDRLDDIVRLGRRIVAETGEDPAARDLARELEMAPASLYEHVDNLSEVNDLIRLIVAEEVMETVRGARSQGDPEVPAILDWVCDDRLSANWWLSVDVSLLPESVIDAIDDALARVVPIAPDRRRSFVKAGLALVVAMPEVTCDPHFTRERAVAFYEGLWVDLCRLFGVPT